MADVNVSPQKSVLKRKYENESEDELFFQLENSSKKKSEDTTLKNVQKENKATTASSLFGKVNSPLVQQLSSPSNQTKQSKLVQQQINFGTSTKSPKVPLNEAALAKVKEVEAPVPAKIDTKAPVVETAEACTDKIEYVEKKTSDEWKIEDYLYDKEWQRLLVDEFNKKYFIEINKNIRDGYMKGINRPPKELVFNALNSTKIDKVNLDFA